MRYSRFFLSAFLWTSLSLSSFVHAQSWSGILSPSRAIDWSHAGLPATLPDGETTANPWTPPTRTQCGSTIPSGASPATINAAIAACTPGHYVLLGPGTFTFNNTNLTLFVNNGVTLRGSGPQSTTLNLQGTSQISFSNLSYGTGHCTNWTTGFAVGTTSITATGCSGTPRTGQLLFLQQCDSGFSGTGDPYWEGTGCSTGSAFDNGALYVCGEAAPCQRSGQEVATHWSSQLQTSYISSVTDNGGGSFTFHLDKGLYMPNWGVTLNGQYSTPYVYWAVGPSGVTSYGNGLENMTVYEQSDTPTVEHAVQMTWTYASWIKGVRFLNNAATQFPVPLFIDHTASSLVANNYFFNSLAMTSVYGPTIQQSADSDDLVLNNISANDVGWEGQGSMQGDVFAYNYIRDAFTFDTNDFFEHNAAGMFMLYEGNKAASSEDDDTHGTHDLNTWFRNYLSGWYDPYQGAPHPYAINWGSGSRFENSIANSIGNTSPSSPLNIYLETTNTYNYVYGMGFPAYSDPLVQTTSMRWGNYDSATRAVRWCGTGLETGCGGVSEIPTTLLGNAARFENAVPASHSLPSSFFLPTTAHPSGGTGLSWWKVCTAWTTFPTSCASSQTQPFPPIGPDVTGGIYNAGTANDIPAVVAWKNLPIDTSFQRSYTITGSSWSGGIETLTISGLPNATHLMGGFQIAGGACATSGAGTPTGAEVLMTDSSPTTVSYALASNPGTCTGTMLFPDVRQFDERVYQEDSGSSSTAQPPAPGGLTGSVVTVP